MPCTNKLSLYPASIKLTCSEMSVTSAFNIRSLAMHAVCCLGGHTHHKHITHHLTRTPTHEHTVCSCTHTSPYIHVHFTHHPHTHTTNTLLQLTPTCAPHITHIHTMLDAAHSHKLHTICQTHRSQTRPFLWSHSQIVQSGYGYNYLHLHVPHPISPCIHVTAQLLNVDPFVNRSTGL